MANIILVELTAIVANIILVELTAIVANIILVELTTIVANITVVELTSYSSKNCEWQFFSRLIYFGYTEVFNTQNNSQADINFKIFTFFPTALKKVKIPFYCTTYTKCKACMFHF